MASPASLRNPGPLPSRVRHSLTAWRALVQADVVVLAKSWVVRIWLLILLISFLAVPVAMLVSNGSGSTPASAALAVYLGIFLSVWSMVIIVVSAGSVSLEAEVVADGILSRACTRTQYILAKLASRALVIGGVYLLGASAAAYVSWRYGANDVTFGTMLSGIAIVGLALLMLVSLGVTMSAIFNNTIVSIIGLLLLWHVAGALFAFAGVEYMSPTSLTGRLPEILRDSRAPQVVSCSATRTSVSIIFSKDVSPDSAEQVGNYTVEGPAGTRHVPQTAVYDPATATVVLSGLSPQASGSVTVTVEGVTDGAGNVVSPAANQATSRPIPAASEDDRAAGPVDESPPRPSEESPDSNRNEEGVTPTRESAAAESGGSSRDRGDRPPRVRQVKATRTSVSVTFSQDMDPVEAEELGKYTVESPLGTTHVPKTGAYDPSDRTVLLSGLSFAPGDPVKVTVNDMTGRRGAKIDPRHNSATFSEVQNWKYLVGFGVPALLFALVGVVWFSWRDL